jgi:hypothetical protein
MTWLKRPVHALAGLLATALLVAACGGVDSGGTGQTVQTSSAGRVTGFGSVIVNGIRFDDAGATVVDDDGQPRSRSELRLGMVVDVQGQLHGSSGTGTARRIQFGPDVAGPVDSVDLANGRLVVLGQAVRADLDTLYGDLPNGLADVQAGQLLQVFAFFDPTSGLYTATRIERVTALTQYVLRGRIANLSTAQRTFTIGGATIDYGALAPPNVPTLADGLAVRVTLATTAVSGRWTATRLHTSQRHFPDERDEAELEGFVSDYSGPTSFVVAGVPVDAGSPGLRVKHGSLSDLANGVRVEVEGSMLNGVLVATELDFKRNGDQEFELHGALDTVDVVSRTLSLRGVTVDWDDATQFNAGLASDLAVGVRIEVRGTPSGGGTRLRADFIRFER